MERLKPMSRHQALMETALIAAERGTCSRLQVGVVFAKDGRIISTGYNGAPAGLPHCQHEQWLPGSGETPGPLLSAWIEQKQKDWDLWRNDGGHIADYTSIEVTLGEPINPAQYASNMWLWVWESGNVSFINRGSEIPGCSTAEHAERNAIAFAARHGVALEGSEMYVTNMPCKPCAMSVINAGVIRVVYLDPYRKTDGVDLLKQAGIVVEEYDDELMPRPYKGD